MRRVEVLEAYQGKRIFPEFHVTVLGFDRENFRDYHTKVETWLRMKHTDGKWYLCYISKEFTTESQLTGIPVGLLYEVMRMKQFGIVAPDMVSPTAMSHPMFELDKCQLSEEGRFYMLDDLLFPKRNQPSLNTPYGPEMMYLWLLHFAPNAPEPDYGIYGL